MKDMDTLMREQARLIMLKALAAREDETLNSDLMIYELEPFGIRKAREWVHGEYAYLAEMGAITVMVAGSVHVATLSALGNRHLLRQITIPGVRRPSRAGE